MSATSVTQHVRAPRTAVFRALIDPVSVAAWRVPDGMDSEVHELDAREGGAFRVSLHYRRPTGSGKSSAATDTFHGRFLELVRDERVVEALEFETDDPQLRGEMTITTRLTDADGGTDVSLVHEGVPPGVRPEDNELGTRMALARLAALVEAERR